MPRKGWVLLHIKVCQWAIIEAWKNKKLAFGSFLDSLEIVVSWEFFVAEFFVGAAKILARG